MRPTKIRRNGLDWLHYFGHGRVLAAESPILRPRRFCSTNIPLFTHKYSPKVGDVVVDLGAGIGADVLTWSKMVGQDGVVVAVEADPDAFRRLERNIELNSLGNTRAVFGAVLDYQGFAHIAGSSPNALCNRVVNHSDRTEANINPASLVPAMTLDQLLASLSLSHVNFLKMNIEGSEARVLSASRECFAVVKNWCISCHDFLGIPEAHTLKAVTEALGRHGLNLDIHPRDEGRPWVGYYAYASLPRSRQVA